MASCSSATYEGVNLSNCIV